LGESLFPGNGPGVPDNGMVSAEEMGVDLKNWNA